MLLTETRELQENLDQKELLGSQENLERRENQAKLQIQFVHHLVIRWVFEVIGRLERGFKSINAIGPRKP